LANGYEELLIQFHRVKSFKILLIIYRLKFGILNGKGKKKTPMPFPSISKKKLESGPLERHPCIQDPHGALVATIVGSLRTREEP
jgi:hypothetical protein